MNIEIYYYHGKTAEFEKELKDKLSKANIEFTDEERNGWDIVKIPDCTLDDFVLAWEKRCLIIPWDEENIQIFITQYHSFSPR